MFSCKSIHQKVSDYQAGHMTFWDRLSFKLHVLLCLHCRRYVRQFNLMLAGLRGIKTTPSDSDEVDDLLKLIEGDKHGK